MVTLQKLFLLINPNESFLEDKVVEILDNNFNTTLSKCRKIDTWNVGISKENNLFLEPEVIVLNLTDKNKLKQFTELVDNKKVTEFNDNSWIGAGVIIYTTHTQGAKKIETLCKKYNGNIQLKQTSQEHKLAILNELGFTQQQKDFLSNYVGEDFTLLLNIKKGVKNKTVEEIQDLSLYDLYLFLPQKPGSVPPWEVVELVLQCKKSEAIKRLTRVLEHTHPLVIMVFLKQKIDLLYKVTTLRLTGISDKDSIVRILNLKNAYSLISINKMMRKPNYETTEYLLKLVAISEQELKGSQNIKDLNTYMEILLMKIMLAIESNIPIDKI